MRIQGHCPLNQMRFTILYVEVIKTIVVIFARVRYVRSASFTSHSTSGSESTVR